MILLFPGIIIILLLHIIPVLILNKLNNDITDSTPKTIRTEGEVCNHLFKYESTEKPQHCPWCKSEL